MVASDKSIEQRLKEAEENNQSGRHDSAITICQKILKEHPDDRKVNFFLGSLQLKKGQKTQALEHLSIACGKNTSNSDHLGLFAQALEQNNYYALAKEKYLTALNFDSGNIQALIGIGRLLLKLEQFTEAHDYLKKALELQPENLEATIHFSGVLSQLDQNDEALKYAEKVVKMAPNDPHSLYCMGRLQGFLGKFKDAQCTLLKTVEIFPEFGAAYATLAATKKFTLEDKELLSKMESLLNTPLGKETRDHIHFALGKAYNDLKQWDKAFSHYEKGNDLIVSNFSQNFYRQFIRETKKLFTPDFLHQMQKFGNQSDVPVFILGMPRSGSTLTDQILSSHSKIMSVGELPDIEFLLQEKSKEKGDSHPNWLGSAIENDIHSMSDKYLKSILKISKPNTLRIVNKMPFNFFHIGIIKILFPNAKIIHTARDPIDTCVSCYFQRFASKQLNWATKLEELGAYYRFYREMISFWEAFPELDILTIDYEQLTSDFETQARKIIDYCGLEWESGCAEFYKNKREVKTASLAQVRQPIYSSSVKRWKHYARHLGPLVASLGDVVDDRYPELEEAGVPLGTFRKWKNKLSPKKNTNPDT